MTPVISFLSTPAMQALAWSLVHFLWQGTVLALAAAAVMRWMAPTARARYVTGVATLALMLAAPAGTFVMLRTERAAGTLADTSLQPPAAGLVVTTEIVVEVPAAAASASPTNRLLPALMLIWIGGVCILSARLLGGWAVARRLAMTTRQPVEADVEALAARVAERLGVRRFVRLAESSVVAVPIVIGWLKPVVLVPSAAVAGLPPAHLEALLAHELAHVRRHDYLVNLLQSAIETLLFYHPAVWWVSGRVRQEREHCCDDEAVAVCDRIVYVRALTNLAAMTVQTRLALAATDGSLLRRVRRLLTSAPDQRASGGWLSMAIVGVVLTGLTPALMAVASDPQATPAPAPTPLVAPVPQPAPRPVTAPTPGPSPTIVAAVSPGSGSVAALPGGQAGDQSPATADERAAQMMRELEALRQQLREREIERAELARRSQREREITLQVAQAELGLRREAAREALGNAERDAQLLSSRVERGSADLEAVASARARLAAAQRELRRIETEMESAQVQQEIEAQRATTERERAQNLRALEAALAETARASATAARAEATTQQQGIYTIGGDVREPKLLTRVAPVYPPLAKAARMQGPVYVEAIIGRDGRVREANPVGGAPFPPLREAAVAAVRQWVYTPTVVNNEPVEVQLSVQVVFKLDDGAATAARPVPGAYPLDDPAARVRAGDLVVVDIAGEDQLPRWYVVESGGTIRLPLLGRIAVVDQTAAQVREGVTRALAERNLAQGRTVAVVIHRPRVMDSPQVR
jgi:TonB family protein